MLKFFNELFRRLMCFLGRHEWYYQTVWLGDKPPFVQPICMNCLHIKDEQKNLQPDPPALAAVTDPGCICHGNWRAIVAKTEHLIGKRFVRTARRGNKADVYTFFGIVHGKDDYYYGMYNTSNRKLSLLSCVGSIDMHGFTLKE